MWTERKNDLKLPTILSGKELGTPRILAQCFNQLRHRLLLKYGFSTDSSPFGCQVTRCLQATSLNRLAVYNKFQVTDLHV